MTHKDLVLIGERWLRRNGCPVTFRELVTTAPETPDVFGFHHMRSALIECKVSRSDFFADQKKWHRKTEGEGVGQFRYYLCPAGLIKPEELPAKWGLLYAESYRKVKLITGILPNAYYSTNDWLHEANLKRERAIMYSALRRLALRGHLESIYEQPWKQVAMKP